jgi:hypothetical protein
MTSDQQQQPYQYNGSGNGGGGGGGNAELDRLWNLLCELSLQLSENRQQTENLHRRAQMLKVGVVH